MRAPQLVAASALVLALAGCGGPAVEPSPGASAPVSPTPNPSPSQERETGLTQPRQVFRGDCTNLFSEAEVGAALGFTMTLSPQSEIFDSDGVIDEQNGGLRCEWVAEGYAALVDVLVLPADAVPYSENSSCAMSLEGGIGGCALEYISNGIRISGIEGRLDRDPSIIASAQTTLLALFTERATPENAAPVPVAAAGSWSYQVDCEAIVAAVDFSAVPGLGASSVGWTGGGGSDAYYPRAVADLWGDLGLPHCVIDGESVSLYFDAFGGGRWKEAELSAAPGTTVLAADGIDAVYATPLGDGTSRINVFDGPNWLQFTVNFTKNAGLIATRLVASLDATAID